MNRLGRVMAAVQLSAASFVMAGAPTGSDSPCQQNSAADQHSPDSSARSAPPPSRSDAFPDYELQANTSRKLPMTPMQAAAMLLDFEQQCSSCTYRLGNIANQEIFERDQIPHRFLVWRHVRKDINIGFKKLAIQSSSFAEVRVFESSDRQHIVIDTRSLSDTCAAQKALLYSKPNDPAFDPLQTRWTLTGLDPNQHNGMQVEIKGTTAGVPLGIAAKAPKPMLSWEFKHAMEESLDSIAP